MVSVKRKGESLNMNWYRNAFYQTSNNAKKRFKRQIAEQLVNCDPLNGRLRIDYIYYAKRNGTDLDNFTSAHKKFFQDSLTEMGVIVDDNVSVIVETREKYAGIDKENPRVEVVVFELDS